MRYPLKPFESCYWLKPGFLLAGEVPCSPSGSETIAKLRSLQSVGISTFISLLSDEDMTFNGSQKTEIISSFPDYQPVLKEIAVEDEPPMVCYRFPIIDRKIPTIDLMEQILNTIDGELEQNRPVYFHCFAGIGRTGTVAGCWLKRHHRQPDDMDSLNYLHEIRMEQGLSIYGRSPETEEQREFVLNWPLRA